MSRARIQNLNRRTTGAEREAFESGVFSSPAGSSRVGTLHWGDEVQLLERRSRRARVRGEGGLEGWVANEDVVELRWVRRRGKEERL